MSFKIQRKLSVLFSLLLSSEFWLTHHWNLVKTYSPLADFSRSEISFVVLMNWSIFAFFISTVNNSSLERPDFFLNEILFSKILKLWKVIHLFSAIHSENNIPDDYPKIGNLWISLFYSLSNPSKYSDLMSYVIKIIDLYFLSCFFLPTQTFNYKNWDCGLWAWQFGNLKPM